ncbi:Uu.00g052250.m01.CDS01 [Anthostomella pinea]|uniref:Uu.00g052250.m01.CDS01 n=1 Tax=Anthostomella pinea TaxID=933095 RepID=A0AAI8VX51_9PEZI|nr:Uu.00g052250.m01.CDS01 [Anthostomella pinea]
MSQDDMETAFQAAIDKGTLNGVLVCASDAAGNFVYEKTLGRRTLLSGEKRPHRRDDVLFLASATKLLTTIAALQCVEDGTLSLTGDLAAVAPDLVAKQVLKGFDDDGETPILEPQARNVTLEMLLTHSSGLTYHFLDPNVARWRAKFAPQAQAQAQAETKAETKTKTGDERKMTVEQLFCYPLSFQPGSSWMYGPGLDWAGRLIERATGRTLGEHLHARVFAPLGIADAQFHPVTRPDLRARLVDLNSADPDALGRAVLGGGGDVNRTTRGDFGGQGLFMTAPDYLAVLKSLLAKDGKILKPETVNDMFRDHLSPESSTKLGEALLGPGGPFFRVGTDAGARAGHGLGGLLTLQDVEGWYGERTLTWGGGMTFTWFIDRENDLCGLGALQASLPVDVPAVEALKQTFRRDIYRKCSAWQEQQQKS